MSARHLEGIGIVVDVGELVTAKIDRVGKERPGAAEKFGMINLQGKRLPSSRGTARQHARLGPRNHPEVLLQVTDQFGQKRVPIGAVVS